MMQYAHESYLDLPPVIDSSDPSWSYDEIFEFIDLDNTPNTTSDSSSDYSPSTHQSCESTRDGAVENSSFSLSTSLEELEAKLLEVLRPYATPTFEGSDVEQAVDYAGDICVSSPHVPSSPYESHICSVPASPCFPKTPIQSPCTPSIDAFDLLPARMPWSHKSAHASPAKVVKPKSMVTKHCATRQMSPTANGLPLDSGPAAQHRSSATFEEWLSLQSWDASSHQPIPHDRSRAATQGPSSSMPDLNIGLGIAGTGLAANFPVAPALLSKTTAPAMAHVNGLPRPVFRDIHRHPFMGSYTPPETIPPALLHRNPHSQDAGRYLATYPWLSSHSLLPPYDDQQQIPQMPGGHFCNPWTTPHTPRMRVPPLHSYRDRSTAHKRSKSGSHITKHSTSNSGRSHHAHQRQASHGFVNFTPNDGSKILNAVTPSGSSKTKARREKEAAERLQSQIEAAKRAVQMVGGDMDVFNVDEKVVELEMV